jgi:ribosomal protein L28
LNSGKACYHSVKNLLSSHLLSKNVKITIWKNVILPVVLYWCKIWSLTLREEHKLKMSEKTIRTEDGQSERRLQKIS